MQGERFMKLNIVILKTCEPDRTRRYQTAEDLETPLLEVREVNRMRLSRKFAECKTKTFNHSEVAGVTRLIRLKFISQAGRFVKIRRPEIQKLWPNI